MLLFFRDNHPKHSDLHEHNGAFAKLTLTFGTCETLAAWPCRQQRSPTKAVSLHIVLLSCYQSSAHRTTLVLPIIGTSYYSRATNHHFILQFITNDISNEWHEILATKPAWHQIRLNYYYLLLFTTICASVYKHVPICTSSVKVYKSGV
jgi:hypothetical protein